MSDGGGGKGEGEGKEEEEEEYARITTRIVQTTYFPKLPVKFLARAALIYVAEGGILPCDFFLSASWQLFDVSAIPT